MSSTSRMCRREMGPNLISPTFHVPEDFGRAQGLSTWPERLSQSPCFLQVLARWGRQSALIYRLYERLRLRVPPQDAVKTAQYISNSRKTWHFNRTSVCVHPPIRRRLSEVPRAHTALPDAGHLAMTGYSVSMKINARGLRRPTERPAPAVGGPFLNWIQLFDVTQVP